MLDEFCEYLEKARLHPTGRHLVDNLITPTLLIHQLLRSESEGIGYFNSSAFHGYSRTLSTLATTTMQDTYHGIAAKWLCYCVPWQRMTTLWRICLQTQGRQLECSVGRPVRGVDGNTDWKRWTERHHVIPRTIGGTDRLISHISIRSICSRPFILSRSSKQL